MWELSAEFTGFAVHVRARCWPCIHVVTTEETFVSTEGIVISGTKTVANNTFSVVVSNHFRNSLDLIMIIFSCRRDMKSNLHICGFTCFSRVSPSCSVRVSGFFSKSGVLHPSGTSFTNWVITTPGIEDFLNIFTGKARKKYIQLTCLSSRKNLSVCIASCRAITAPAQLLLGHKGPSHSSATGCKHDPKLGH